MALGTTPPPSRPNPSEATEQWLAQGHLAVLVEHLLRNMHEMPAWLGAAAREMLLPCEDHRLDPALWGIEGTAAQPQLLPAAMIAERDVGVLRLDAARAATVRAAMFELRDASGASSPAQMRGASVVIPFGAAVDERTLLLVLSQPVRAYLL